MYDIKFRVMPLDAREHSLVLCGSVNLRSTSCTSALLVENHGLDARVLRLIDNYVISSVQLLVKCHSEISRIGAEPFWFFKLFGAVILINYATLII